MVFTVIAQVRKTEHLGNQPIYALSDGPTDTQLIFCRAGWSFYYLAPVSGRSEPK